MFSLFSLEYFVNVQKVQIDSLLILVNIVFVGMECLVVFNLNIVCNLMEDGVGFVCVLFGVKDFQDFVVIQGLLV